MCILRLQNLKNCRKCIANLRNCGCGPPLAVFVVADLSVNLWCPALVKPRIPHRSEYRASSGNVDASVEKYYR